MHPLRELTLADLRRRTSVKWRQYEPDVLPLWVAEMDVRLAAPIAEAVTAAVAEGDTGYPAGTGYAEAFADFAAQRWSWQGLDASRAVLAADVMTGVVEAIRLVSAPGDPVVINPPVYPLFWQFLEHAGRSVVEAPLGEDGRLDLDSLEAGFIRAGADHRAVTYLLCNPQNPTAVAHTAAELAGVAALAEAYAVRVVVDEIHGPLVPYGFVPYLTIPGSSNAFAVTSASKAWNLAGAKAALVVGGEDTADDLRRLPAIVADGAGHLGVIAHTAALRDGVPWLDALQADLADNRAQLAALLHDLLPEVRWARGDATYLAWLDCRDLGLGDDPAAVFFERGRVALSSGRPFGAAGVGHVRLNFATTPEILTAAVTRMAVTIGR